MVPNCEAKVAIPQPHWGLYEYKEGRILEGNAHSRNLLGVLLLVSNPPIYAQVTQLSIADDPGDYVIVTDVNPPKSRS